MKPWLTALSLSSMGFYIAGSIVLGIIGGRWVDEKLETAPLFFIIGLIIGLTVAVYGTYNMLKPFLKNNDYNKKDKES